MPRKPFKPLLDAEFVEDLVSSYVYLLDWEKPDILSWIVRDRITSKGYAKRIYKMMMAYFNGKNNRAAKKIRRLLGEIAPEEIQKYRNKRLKGAK